jgi:hypothetical protein
MMTVQWVVVLFSSAWNLLQHILTRLFAGQSEVQIMAGVRDLSLLHTIHTGSGAHRSIHCMDTGGNVSSHLHLMPWLRMGTSPLLCAFMACVGATSPLHVECGMVLL